jgi:hypothetical protein
MLAGVEAACGGREMRAVARAGWNGLPPRFGSGVETRWSFGGGLSYARLNLNLAHASLGALGNELVVSAGFGW